MDSKEYGDEFFIYAMTLLEEQERKERQGEGDTDEEDDIDKENPAD